MSENKTKPGGEPDEMRQEPEEWVTLVDELDRDVGRAPKLQVHRTGELHRAVSVFLFDRTGKLLLQRRALHKYHSPGLWSNTCCGHPRPGESALEAARRRLAEEMGIVCELTAEGAFTYRAALGEDLVEHELDHVFVGEFEGEPRPNRNEVAEWRWISLSDVRADCARHPERYSAWLPLALDRQFPR